MRHKIRSILRRRRNRVLAIFIAVNFILAFLIYSNLLTYPNTFIGTTNVSGKTAGQIKTLLTKEQSILPKIQVKDRTYQYTYAQLGIVVDQNLAVHDAFAPNRKLFPLNLFSFFQSLVTKRTIAPPLMFTQAFDQFVSDMTFNFGDTPDDISVDPETKSLVVSENSEFYRFDKQSLRALLVTHFGSYVHPVYPQLAKITNVTITQVSDVNQKIAHIFSRPMMVYLDMGGTTPGVELKEEDIREATVIAVTPGTLHVSIAVDPTALNSVITRRVHASGFPIRDIVVTKNVQDDFLNAINLRFAGEDIAAVSTTLDDGPNTDGSVADKYIEVDISQQRMYLFQNGKVLKTFPVSTGLDEPTPIGKFTVLNKMGLGFSTIYNVWLPWWMGFSYSDKLHAYFGIHEQPYVLTSEGKPIIPDNRLGTPSTGGCVALAPGAAQEVYWFASIGTPVYIYN